jgi:adenine-specific DNA methylase
LREGAGSIIPAPSLKVPDVFIPQYFLNLLTENPKTGNRKHYYLFNDRTSSIMVSVVVMIREFAWKARW